ncbi:hypothetical protein SAMN05421770_11041 [Granulicella rosea]|uniref:Uncharacterized protein n=1 Tax=Granulicella rosea TaxID=474952 RepID=A0A239M808_9BACT|nr:hypothetical protein [Granulicella rosea]SNT38253.1 hypothetical protein SAMN05421770_11041 [Granulicella rosea]
MAGNRAFKGLASLRAGFDQPFEDDIPEPIPARPEPVLERVQATVHQPEPPRMMPQPVAVAPVHSEPRQFGGPQAVSPITGKVDRRRLRKVLKTPSVSLSVAVRAELHEEVSALLFARKTTWIATLDELLTQYVAEAKATGRFPR